jgi:GntR family transcriptional regulator
MQFQIDAADGVPIYLQLIQQIKYLIATGRLSASDQLPSVRKLSEQLVVNPNTVARAYRELEMGGILATRPGAGVFVSPTASPLAKREQHQLLVDKIDNVLVEAKHLEVSTEGVVQLVRQRARALTAAGG